jgi:hypothetical protein
MRFALTLPILVGVLGCAGCSSNILHPTAVAERPVEHAMNDAEKRRFIRPHDRPRKVASSSPDVTNGAASPESSIKPKYFSPEWWARVRQEDESLKKAMSICQGC